ncbi:MAG: single-stranded-DNA-specific exonuclease RecJ [Desulfobulbaceae bacterium]|nr:single-stranded-DNA-specific exonuclease RecJ [Desulfobulbaceae bacterium]
MAEKDIMRSRAVQENFHYEPPDREQCARLALELGMPYPMAVLLRQRGVRDARQAEDFFNPRLADLPSPFLMKDMDRAVALVIQALRENWPLYIHGDYDVDGITSCALLSRFFYKLGRDTICYQPDRLTEGYGLQAGFIRAHAPVQGQPALLITVDCGIADFEEVQLARELGFKVIVTDHHLPGDVLPPADALLNPHRRDCTFPHPELAGVGVAFFLAYGIRKSLIEQEGVDKEKTPNLKQLMDMVAMGTVADVMPLTGINRILVRAGLEVMNQPDCVWAQALQEQQNNFTGGLFTAEDISYRFAPRINAPGRLGKPGLSFHLLSTGDPVKCRQLAAQIEAVNSNRRELEGMALNEVLAECKEQENAGAAAFVVYGSYHQGIIGIIASRVVDRFSKPVVIFTDDTSRDGTIKGSGRSVAGVNLYDVLQSCADSIIQFGGHAMAAGLALNKKNLQYFTALFTEAVAAMNIRGVDNAIIQVDYCPEPEEILESEFFRHYRKMEPFGNGNPEPVFLFDSPGFIETGTVKNHLTYTLQSGGKVYRGIGFGMGEKIELIRKGPVQLAFKLKNTVYRGESRIELHAVDVSATP